MELVRDILVIVALLLGFLLGRYSIAPELTREQLSEAKRRVSRKITGKSGLTIHSPSKKAESEKLVDSFDDEV